MDKQKALKDIIQHTELCDPDTEKWYVGLTDDIKKFCDLHGIKQEIDLWITKQLDSEKIAMEIKKYLSENLGMDSRDDEEKGLYVVSYRKDEHTNP